MGISRSNFLKSIGLTRTGFLKTGIARVSYLASTVLIPLFSILSGLVVTASPATSTAGSVVIAKATKQALTINAPVPVSTSGSLVIGNADPLAVTITAPASGSSAGSVIISTQEGLSLVVDAPGSVSTAGVVLVANADAQDLVVTAPAPESTAGSVALNSDSQSLVITSPVAGSTSGSVSIVNATPQGISISAPAPVSTPGSVAVVAEGDQGLTVSAPAAVSGAGSISLDNATPQGLVINAPPAGSSSGSVVVANSSPQELSITAPGASSTSGSVSLAKAAAQALTINAPVFAVSGAGSSGFNGIYYKQGAIYKGPGIAFCSKIDGGTRWALSDTLVRYRHTQTGIEFPWQGTWELVSGSNPLPALSSYLGTAGSVALANADPQSVFIGFPSYVASGSGSSQADGAYSQIGEYEGYPWYRNAYGCNLRMNGGHWNVLDSDDSTLLYWAVQAGGTPSTVTWIPGGLGEPPEPTFVSSASTPGSVSIAKATPLPLSITAPVAGSSAGSTTITKATPQALTINAPGSASTSGSISIAKATPQTLSITAPAAVSTAGSVGLALGGGTYETEAQAYFDALSGAGYGLSESEKTWVNNRVLNLKGTAAGDIDGDELDVWDDIENLVLPTLYNAGAGNTVYALVGGNASGSVAWEADGWRVISGSFAFKSGSLETAHGLHAGWSGLCDGKGNSTNWSDWNFFYRLGDPFALRMAQASNKQIQYNGSTVTHTAWPTPNVLKWTSENHIGDSVGVVRNWIKPEIDFSDWDSPQSADDFSLPNTSDEKSSPELTDKGNWSIILNLNAHYSLSDIGKLWTILHAAN